MALSSFNPIPSLSIELNIPEKWVTAAVKLLNDGNTIPFIARYRKEATNNLDEVQIRQIQERLHDLIELEKRRHVILNSIESQGKLTESLKRQIEECTSQNLLEDLYLPYKPKRRTKAAIAREKGLEPLALRIIEQPIQGDPLEEAAFYVNAAKGVQDAEEGLSGARDIVAEIIAENADIRQVIRQAFAEDGAIISRVVEGKDQTPTKFEQYYKFEEKVTKIPSHRYLALRRGEKENILQLEIKIDDELMQTEMRKIMRFSAASPFANHLALAIKDSYKRLILTSMETDERVDLKLKADRAAVDVFADNLRHLLLSAPLGGKSVVGIDPGFRTGCKCAAIDQTGKFLDSLTIFPEQGDHAEQRAKVEFLKFVNKFSPFAIGIGNGTAGRETESFVNKVLRDSHLQHILVVSISEAGASVYSASDIAREEFPHLDLTIRGAISIARRLQDPLAELVKIDPKAIGVGQYQHDVYQPLLQNKLHEVVESCVNHVGVDINTASAPLLSYVAGIGPSLALKIVKHREQFGPFKSRSVMLEVSGLGTKTFEQAAGFLRVRGSSHPLDASAVHPERYSLVEIIANDMKIPLENLIGNEALISHIQIQKYVSDTVGEHTLRDIISELKKPGRDPRAIFEGPIFQDDVRTLQDLKIGMKLEGIITNVTAFGAFVDIGVHQDGLIHLSQLSDRFIKDPSEVVRVGDRIKVEILDVDVERKRISLTARIGKSEVSNQQTKSMKNVSKTKAPFVNNPFASLKN